MIIEANSLAEDLRGISIFERIAYSSIFILGLLTIRTGEVLQICETNIMYDGIQWELALVPLTLLGDVTKSYNISLLIVGVAQTLLCKLRLQFLIIFLIYRMLGKHNLIYSLLYILPQLINQILPYKKWIFIYVQFILTLLIIMLNKNIVQNKQKSNYNLKYFGSRLIVCIIMFQYLGINDEELSNDQLILMLLSLPAVRLCCKYVPPIYFGVLFLIFYYLPEEYLQIKLILQALLVAYLVISLLPTVVNDKFAMTISLMIPMLAADEFKLPEYSFIFLSLLLISEPPKNLYEQIEL